MSIIEEDNESCNSSHGKCPIRSSELFIATDDSDEEEKEPTPKKQIGPEEANKILIDVGLNTVNINLRSTPCPTRQIPKTSMSPMRE